MVLSIVLCEGEVRMRENTEQEQNKDRVICYYSNWIELVIGKAA